MNSPKSARRPRRRAGRGPGRPAGRTARDGVIADRDTLLAAAERLIRRKGPGVTLDEIAAEAGVTKPILYRGVGDRKSLVNALAERLVARMTDHVTRQVALASTAHEQLRQLVRGYLQHAGSDRHLYQYVTLHASGDDPVRQSLLLADSTSRQLAEDIAAHRAANGADPSVAATWAYGLVGALHFVTLWWLRDQALGVEQVSEHVTALLWSGLRLETGG